MKRLLLTPCVLFLILYAHQGTSFSGEIYKWIDENGIMHFTDSLNDKSIIEKHNVEMITVKDYQEIPAPASEQTEPKPKGKTEWEKPIKEKETIKDKPSKYYKKKLMKLDGQLLQKFLKIQIRIQILRRRQAWNQRTIIMLSIQIILKKMEKKNLTEP